MTESNEICMFKFIKTCLTFFQSICTFLHSASSVENSSLHIFANTGLVSLFDRSLLVGE